MSEMIRPHRIHLSHGGEYAGETYMWCECKTPPGERPVHLFGHGNSHMFGALFEVTALGDDEGPERLTAWMEEHSEHEWRRKDEPGRQADD